MPTSNSLTTALLAALLLAGCAVDPASREVPTPADWEIARADTRWPDADWWRQLGSTELDGLIAEAQRANLDLAAASSRVLQAELQARNAGGALLPSVSLSGRGGRSGEVGGNEASSDSYSADLGASYEIDLWGRNRFNRDAAVASFEASRFNRDTAALTVTVGVVNGYLQVLSLRERLAIARDNLANAERVLALVETRERYGAAGQLELTQQRSVVTSQRAALPPLEQQEREARSALALLLGRAPQGFTVAGTSLGDVGTLPALSGLPSELLLRRPDVRAAEAQLSGADANLSAARAALFPSLSLSAGLGVSDGSLSSLFDNDPRYSISAGLSQVIFDGGRLRNQRKIADARRDELLAGYRSAVISAFADTENALGAAATLARQVELQAELLAQAQLTFQLAEARYRAGAIDLMSLLDAQRSLYSAQDQNRQMRLNHLQALTGLYRALGGGWLAPGAG